LTIRYVKPIMVPAKGKNSENTRSIPRAEAQWSSARAAQWGERIA
jgi:hypothetical protein